MLAIMRADAWTAVGTWATFLVLAITATIALRQADEARKLRVEQSRPFVVVDFEPWNVFARVAIENYGRTLAHNISMRFEPPLESTQSDAVEKLSVLLTDGIPMLPPRKQIRYFFDVAPIRAESNLPLTYSVTVEYEAPSGESYRDEYKLDLRHLLGSTLAEPTLRDIVDVLQSMRDEVKNLGPT